jgi:lipopolysaccharide transport system ATP-binding protein
MGTVVISGLGKAYKNYPTRFARLAEWILPRTGPRHQLRWILQDVSFTVRPGEALAVVGINGAGKSTLLKMIAGTLQPTTGSIQMTGRVAALLELGMGFHPDFTGRQNAVMAGQLLGLKVEEISRLMPFIEEFSEIGEYIDEPVRVYSSGMQVRLAFSVATAVRPDILIVDEALSVGDAHFQHKSFERIREFRKLGTTLLIVSHDKAAIQSICDSAVLLNAGRVAFTGEPEAVMDYYNAMLADSEASRVQQHAAPDGKVRTVSGSGEATIEQVSLHDQDGQQVEVVRVGQPVSLKLHVRAAAHVPDLVAGYMIKDRLGQAVFGTNTHHLKADIAALKPGESVCVSFDFAANLGEGSYSVAVALHAGDTHVGKNYEWRDLAVLFTVVNADKERFVGVAWLPPKLGIQQ